MKRTLAITAATAMLALSLAGCGATRNGDMDLLPDYDATNGYGTTATDTMRDDNATNGTGTTSGVTNYGTDNNGVVDNGTGLGSVTGAVNRATSGNGATQYGLARYGANSGAYTATNNGGLTAGSNVDYSNASAVKRAARQGDRYARMLENGRVHDSDGFLLDGENASYRTY